jgi:hypothetical protein
MGKIEKHEARLVSKGYTQKYDINGWTDSDYAGDLDDRKSTSGYVFKLGSEAVS